jgi:hypothetical protein
MPQGEARSVAQIRSGPETEQIPDATKPTGAEGSLLLLMQRISALALAAEAYFKVMAAIVLLTLAIGLLFMMVIIHRIANRILMSITPSGPAGARHVPRI